MTAESFIVFFCAHYLLLATCYATYLPILALHLPRSSSDPSFLNPRSDVLRASVTEPE
jgi:hypothetical protein